MKILTSKYRIISVEGEYLENVYFPKFDVFKEVSVFGFSLYGEMVNRELFNDMKDAEDFLKILETQTRPWAKRDCKPCRYYFDEELNKWFLTSKKSVKIY